VKTAIEYLNEQGIPWRRSGEAEEFLPPTWDGKVLTLDWLERGDALPSSVEWVFHEISHHLLAPRESLRLPNYGLGSDPAGGGETRVVWGASRGRDPDEDESAVCILDLVRMLEEGLSESLIRYHANNYNIHSLGERDFELLGQIGFSRERVERIRPFLSDGR
jgi:hypothetical protein